MTYYGQYPRQPKAKPPVVYTNESVDYDDRTTTALIKAAVQDNQQKKEPTMASTKLPLHRQGDDVVQAIVTNCTVGTLFTAELVWTALGAEKREQWIKAYGGRDKAYSKVKVALNNINSSGRIGIERVDGTDEFRLTSNAQVPPSPAYQRSVNKSAATKADNVPKPADSGVPKHAGYRHVGFNSNGVPLYVEHKSQRVGLVVVTTKFVVV